MAIPLSVLKGEPDAILKYMHKVLGVNPYLGDNELQVWADMPVDVSLSDSAVNTAATNALSAPDATAAMAKIRSRKNLTK